MAQAKRNTLNSGCLYRRYLERKPGIRHDARPLPSAGRD